MNSSDGEMHQVNSFCLVTGGMSLATLAKTRSWAWSCYIDVTSEDNR